MRKYWKEITIVILLAILVWGNSQYDEVHEELRTSMVAISKLKETNTTKENVRIVEKIVEVTKDGTTKTTERTTDTDTEEVTEKKQEDVSVEAEEKIVEKKETKKNFAVTISTPILLDNDISDIEITAGTRILNSSFWIEGGYDLRHKEVSVGLRLEF